MPLTKYQDFVELSTSQLKDYLTVRGVTTSGNKKVELVAKAFGRCNANPGFTTCTPKDFSIVILVTCRHEIVKLPNIQNIFGIAPLILTKPIRLPGKFSTDSQPQ